MDLRPGDEVFGPTKEDVYEVVRILGTGAFGIVYELRDLRGGLFALKTITTGWLDTPQQLKALVNEGQRATEIHHENVLNVLFFHDGEKYPELPPYMIMEYADGGSLADVLDERRKRGKQFGLEELRAIFLQLARGMKAVNEKLVHRDIKPDNILIKDDVLKISDFGLSKVVGAATRRETFKGMQHIKYAAPEAWLLEKNTPTMDMYSMGIVFYEIATLHHPYKVQEGGNVVDAWKRAHLVQMAEDPRSHNSGLDLSLTQLIMKMVAKRPEVRYESWDEVIARLEGLSEGSTKSRDVQSLVEQAVQKWTQAEKARLKVEEEAQKQQEREDLIEYAFSQILDAARETVNTFNEGSEHLKLQLKQRSRFSFFIELKDTPKPGIQVKIAPVHDTHILNRQEVRAWGFAKAPSGWGFNLILTTAGKEDLYGSWLTLHVEHSPLVQQPKDDRPEPFPFELHELAEEIRLLDALHVYHTKKGDFKPELFDPLIAELF